MAAQRARPILLNERFLVYLYIMYVAVRPFWSRNAQRANVGPAG